jgi:hypothetical protein
MLARASMSARSFSRLRCLVCGETKRLSRIYAVSKVAWILVIWSLPDECPRRHVCPGSMPDSRFKAGPCGSWHVRKRSSVVEAFPYSRPPPSEAAGNHARCARGRCKASSPVTANINGIQVGSRQGLKTSPVPAESCCAAFSLFGGSKLQKHQCSGGLVEVEFRDEFIVAGFGNHHPAPAA